LTKKTEIASIWGDFYFVKKMTKKGKIMTILFWNKNLSFAENVSNTNLSDRI